MFVDPAARAAVSEFEQEHARLGGFELFFLLEREPERRSAGPQPEPDRVRPILLAKEDELPRIEVPQHDEAIEVLPEQRHEIGAAAETAGGTGITRSWMRHGSRL